MCVQQAKRPRKGRWGKDVRAQKDNNANALRAAKALIRAHPAVCHHAIYDASIRTRQQLSALASIVLPSTGDRCAFRHIDVPGSILRAH